MNLRITLAVAVAIVASQVATSFKFSPASKWLSPSSLSAIYKTGAGSRLSLVEKNMMPHMLLSDNKDMSIQCHFNLQMYIDRKSTHRRVVISETSLRMSANDEDEDGDYDDEEISIEEAFDDLSNGKKLAPYEAILEWDVVSELIQEKIITTKEFQKMFIEAGGKETKGKLAINIAGFENLLDLLEPYADDISYDDDDDDDDEESTQHTADGDDDDDSELMEDVFKRLSVGKETISYKNLLTWDVAQDLLADGSVDDKSLKQYFMECGGTDKGINFENFEKLVDILIDLYGESEVDEGDDGTEEGNMIKFSEEGDDEDDDSYVDVETDVVFKELAKGKEFMTLKDFKKWDLISSMIESGQLDDAELADIVEVSGVDNSKIDIIAFEAILDELSFRAESGDDEGGDLEFEK